MSFVNLNKFLFTLREGGFELLILVPQLLESWDYMCVPSYPANKLFLSILSVKCRLFLLCLPHRVVVRIRWLIDVKELKSLKALYKCKLLMHMTSAKARLGSAH
jgi:hypothetical protein